MVEKQDPLKQGLKHCLEVDVNNTFKVEKQDPLKQGLKLIIEVLLSLIRMVEKQDPLKQGLKPFPRPMFRSHAMLKSKIH